MKSTRNNRRNECRPLFIEELGQVQGGADSPPFPPMTTQALGEEGGVCPGAPDYPYPYPYPGDPIDPTQAK